jgi:hypothetical protein
VPCRDDTIFQMIPTFSPKAEIVLHKVVRRTGPSRLNNEIKDISLTEWLGESGSIVIHRIRNSPAVVEITLTDRMSPINEDTIYSLIEPMDAITIRMARKPHEYNRLPVVARVFVDRIRRKAVMDSDGKPVRAVVITATDIIGKTLQLVEIFYKTDYRLGDIPLSQFPLFEKFKIEFDQDTAGEFVAGVVDIANDWLAGLSQRSGFDVPLKINVDASLVTMGKVGPYGIQAYQGNLWNFLTNWCDLAWNELLLEDREDGAWLVYRPKPYRGLDGKPTSQDPSMKDFRPAAIGVDISQIVDMDLSRSDANVANYFNVYAPQAEHIARELLDTFYLQNGSVFTGDQFPNSAYSIYGLKKLQANSGQLSDKYITHPDDLVGAAKAEVGKFMGDWIGWRRDELRRQNIDEVVWEEGSMVLQGLETLRPGVELQVTSGALRSSYYLDSVSLEFKAFQTFLCTIQVTRGTGFVERIRFEGSPYLAESRAGAYGR